MHVLNATFVAGGVPQVQIRAVSAAAGVTPMSKPSVSTLIILFIFLENGF